MTVSENTSQENNAITRMRIILMRVEYRTSLSIWTITEIQCHGILEHGLCSRGAKV